MIPAQIGEYRIVRELGSGGMGTVYEGVHTTLSQRVAIKVVRPEYARDSEVEQRFLKEAMALARVVHPSVVKIHTFGFLPDGTSYLVMEFLSGQSLAQRWRKADQAPDLLKELHLVHQIADVLAVLHSSGVIHRDLKPENVMIVSELDAPETGRAKLVDFGLVKLIRVSGPHTTSALIMGTPAYMSPEQCRGAGQVDAKTDCYALGVMLYELIAGRLPFESKWAGDLIGMHLHVAPPPLAQYVPNLDTRLVALVHDLLSKDKDRRPTMTEAARYLEQLLAELEGRSETGALPPLNPAVDVLAPTLSGPPRQPLQVDQLARTPPAPMPFQGARGALTRNPSKALSGSALPAATMARRLSVATQKNLALLVLLGGPVTLLLGWSIYTIIFWVYELRSNRPQPVIVNSDEPKPASSISGLWATESLSTPIPHSSVKGLNDSKPTDAHEKRIAGNDPQVPIYLSKFIPCSSIIGSYEVCILQNGTVETVEPVISIPGADRNIIDTLSAWRFPVRGEKRCIRQSIRFQVENQERTCQQYAENLTQPVVVPFEWLSENMKGGIYLSPPWPKQLEPLKNCQTRQASYELYINSSGKVYTTSIAQGLDNNNGATDNSIMTALYNWRFRQIAFPVCVTYTLTFRGPIDSSRCESDGSH